MKLYHGTNYKNLSSILAKGLKKSIEGGVYLTDSKKSAVAWTAIRVVASGGDTILVCEVDVDEEKLELGCDHSPMMQEIFGCGESYLYRDDISTDKIKNYTKYGDKENV